MNWKDAIRHGLKLPHLDPKTAWPEAVRATTMALAEHLRNSTAVREYLTALEKGPNTSCPDSPIDELLKSVAYQNGQIDKRDPGVTLRFNMNLMVDVFELERDCIAAVAAANLDITAEERALVRFAIRFAKIIDALYGEWFATIVTPYQELDEPGQLAYCETARPLLAEYDYTVFDYREGAFHDRLTWAQAFRSSRHEINDLLWKVHDDPSIRPEILTYLDALRAAYTCTNISRLEECWAAVDAAWIKIPSSCRTFPVHGMENHYEHPFGVSPEFRLVVRSDHGQDVIAKIRAATPAYARTLGIDAELVTAAEQKMQSIDMGVFTMAVRAGVNLNFRYAGQVVPNRPDILAQGGKTFMDLETMANAVRVHHDLADKHCTPETAEVLKQLIMVDGFFFHTVAHECTHPIGCTAASNKALGDMKSRLEEAKATLGGLAAIISALDANRAAEAAALSIARVCRFFTKATFKNPTIQPYVRENLAMANLLVDAGIFELTVGRVEPTAEGITANLDHDHLAKWSDLLRQFYIDVVHAYHTTNPGQAVHALEEHYCARTPAVNAWLAWVNR